MEERWPHPGTRVLDRVRWPPPARACHHETRQRIHTPHRSIECRPHRHHTQLFDSESIPATRRMKEGSSAPKPEIEGVQNGSLAGLYAGWFYWRFQSRRVGTTSLPDRSIQGGYRLTGEGQLVSRFAAGTTCTSRLVPSRGLPRLSYL